MEQITYSAKDIADKVGIHTNTVRFYEKIGFLTAPTRKSNGYRIYTDLQLKQCMLIRKAMRSEVLLGGLRKKAVETVRLCACLHFSEALISSDEYKEMAMHEIANARNAAQAARNILFDKKKAENVGYRRSDAAKLLSLTPETLRTWERSGLLKVKRIDNGYRIYNSSDMEMLGIIRTLRLAGYSLSAILRLINNLQSIKPDAVESVLNTPDESDDIVSVCDRLIISLNSAINDADEMKRIISEIISEYSTIQ